MTDAADLTLVQLLSPAFPTGAFAYSHGLEQVIADGTVHDAASLGDWLGAVLRYGSGWQDAVLLGMALQSGADLDAVDALALALAASAERLTETTEQGAAFARAAAQVVGTPQPPRALPVAVAAATRPLGPPPERVIALYMQGFATNLVTIGVKAIPLGQSAGQGVLAGLLPDIAAQAARAVTAGPDDLGTACLAADLAAMRHETLETRIYRT